MIAIPHNHRNQMSKQRLLDVKRTTGSRLPVGKLHSPNEGRVLSLPSIPENDMQEIGFEQRYNTVRRRAHGTIPSSLPPLFPRSYHQILPKPSFIDDDEMTPYEMVNMERRKLGLSPFRLSRTMNQLAAQQAARMAKRGTVYHSVSTIDALKVLLRGRDVAENIQRGDGIVAMHIETMRETASINRSNVLSAYFSEFGYGVATGSDGKVYCCQLFRS